jgi:hypothetical protein
VIDGTGPSVPWLTDFLEGFDAADPGGRAPVIRIELVEGLRTPPPVGRLLFATDRFRAHRLDTGIAITNGRSWVVVERGPNIRGEIAAEEPDPEFEILFVALLLALRELRIFELHAAVVCRDDTALVLVGPSGSGKSTATLALVSAGCNYLGDDRVLFRERDDELELLHYPVAFRATSRTLASFPALAPFASANDYLGKYPIDVTGAFPGHLRRAFRGATLLLFPEIGARTELRELSPQPAFERLLLESGSLAVEGHAAPREHLDLLQRLVRRSRCLSLTLGPEWLSAPERSARTLLEGLFARARTVAV